MEKLAIATVSEDTMTPRSGGHEATAEVTTSGRSPTLRPYSQKYYNNQPVGARLYY